MDKQADKIREFAAALNGTKVSNHVLFNSLRVLVLVIILIIIFTLIII
jgi:hypothetical protein